MRSSLLFCLLAAPLARGLLAQKPVVFPGGVVNAASFVKAGQPGYGVAPGSIAAIFGSNLASTTAYAPGLPLPKSLAGTSVTFGGVPAPLFYVSPAQLNVQVPSSQWLFPVNVIVTTAAGSSDPVEARIPTQNIGIFTLDASGCGRGAVFIIGPDGTLTLNGPEHSAQPGDALAIFATGLGALAVGPLPEDGEPSPSNPLAEWRGGAGASLGRLDVESGRAKRGAVMLFSGRAPTLVGLDQFNVALPPDTPEGCSTPLRITPFIGHVPSRPVPLSVRRGGGRCADPPPDSAAVLTWKRSVVFGLSGTEESEELSIDLSAAIGLALPQPSNAVNGCYSQNPMPTPAPVCAWAEDKRLDAGVLTVQGPGMLPFHVAAQPVDGRLTYVAMLPPGTIRPGAFTVTAAGGRDVGPFTTTAILPAPIQLTTTFPPGTSVAGNGPLTLTWKGGDPASVVRFIIIENVTSPPLANECAVPASAGTVTFPRLQFGGIPGGAGEIVIRQSSEQPQIQKFQVPGLTLGGVHGWVYEFRFRDLGI